MDLIGNLEEGITQAIESLYGSKIEKKIISLSPTKKEFDGDYTLVVFPFTKLAKKAPPAIAEEIGIHLKENLDLVTDFNVIKGFLNLTINNSFWFNFLSENADNGSYGNGLPKGNKVMVEFASPNTNKPLHLGHIRNILLGWSTSKILKAAGNEVFNVQIINDRGIAICKSMLAWSKFGNGETPQSSGKKGDHLVGKYYVEFEKHFKAEYSAWMETETAKEVFLTDSKEGQDEAGFFKKYKEKYFNEYSKLGKEAKAMLLKWEAGDEETVALWKKMNGWVYEGFDVTYDKLGVSFDKLYYESDTYLLGKEMIDKGLKDKVFYQKEDSSVWCDLTDAKMDHKIVLRSDGTSVYMTQDIGTAHLRYEDFGVNSMIYTVADEQNYHFKVLFEILKRLGEPYAEGLHHLSYGMVDLPTGKMKSREGTVVDADDLIAEVIGEARSNAAERGELADISKEEQEEIYRKIGLAALKFFIIKVNPKKRMTFDPKESVDLQGQTGPYVQNAYVRIHSVLRKADMDNIDFSLSGNYKSIGDQEKELLNQLFQFPDIIQSAAANYDPSEIANYCYALAKGFHKFYHDFSILKAESEEAKSFRIQLSKFVANALKKGMDLLGIEMPNRM